jgi:hypothetical protein
MVPAGLYQVLSRALEALSSLVGLGGDRASGLARHLDRALRNAPGVVDHLPEVLAHEFGLNSREVLEITALGEPGEALGVLLEPVLGQLDPLSR